MQTIDTYSLKRFNYHLPQELIAQRPSPLRDHSRLMIINRQKGTIEEIAFYEIIDFLTQEDHLVFNDTKVIPARLFGRREKSGGKVEMLLVAPSEEGEWIVMAKPGKKLKSSERVIFAEDFSAEIIETLEDGSKKVRFCCEEGLEKALERYGRLPLPQYIGGGEEKDNDKERYQTVYAKHSGAVAAPTAGLHFTKELLAELERRGCQRSMVTLHVGPGTFVPVKVDDLRDHKMHSERYHIAEKTAEELSLAAQSKRIISVGTTSCRVLESAMQGEKRFVSGAQETEIFIYPGYKFCAVDALLTNFHLPCSTLLMLVSAFAGHDLIMEAYQKAVEKRFRFYSYGDAMLIL